MMTTLTLPPKLIQSPELPEYAPETPDGPAAALPSIIRQELERIIQQIEEEAIIPLLESDDLESAICDSFLRYAGLSRSFGKVLLRELGDPNWSEWTAAAGRELDDFFREYAPSRLGETAAQSLQYAVDIRGLVARSAAASMEIWDESELELVEQHLMAHDLCAAAVAYHLAQSRGPSANAQRLASWSYHYADWAYLQCGLADGNHNLGTLLVR